MSDGAQTARQLAERVLVRVNDGNHDEAKKLLAELVRRADQADRLREERDNWHASAVSDRQRRETAEAEAARERTLREQIEEHNWPYEWQVATADRKKRKAAEAEAARLREALIRLLSWSDRMPDAGFTDKDARWHWWHDRPADFVRAALAGSSAGEKKAGG